jgi:hypothetical protein
LPFEKRLQAMKDASEADDEERFLQCDMKLHRTNLEAVRKAAALPDAELCHESVVLHDRQGLFARSSILLMSPLQATRSMFKRS